MEGEIRFPAKGGSETNQSQTRASALGAHKAPQTPRILHLLAGLAGVGKTTAALKLAISQGLWKGRAVGMFHFDTSRMARQQSMEWYCQAAGITLFSPLQPPQREQLNLLDFLVIDTSSISRITAETCGEPLFEILQNPESGSDWQIFAHLVAPAWAGANYFSAARKQSLPCDLKYLLPTFLDCSLLGEEAMTAAAACDLGVHYLSSGAKVPNGLFESGEQQLAELASALSENSVAGPALGNGHQIASILRGNRYPRFPLAKARAATGESVA
ncbi:MAG: hypothetical protein NW208_00705 [Bryobacter sp.]|nr:hypothetical protein [Bryobacter sp.]